jgi:hypothetical protein
MLGNPDGKRTAVGDHFMSGKTLNVTIAPMSILRLDITM